PRRLALCSLLGAGLRFCCSARIPAGQPTARPGSDAPVVFGSRAQANHKRARSRLRLSARRSPVGSATLYALAPASYSNPSPASSVALRGPRRRRDERAQPRRDGPRGVGAALPSRDVTKGDVELVQVLEERVGTQLTELKLPEEPVLELLSAVSMAKRMAHMDLSKDGFGKRQENNRKKHGGSAAAAGGKGAAREGNKSAQAAGKGGAVKGTGKRAGAKGAGGGKKGAERVRSERGAQARVEQAL
ncbi:hypothetical protein DMC30DRAFT_126134, partial [Rhodotorula diobovata]